MISMKKRVCFLAVTSISLLALNSCASAPADPVGTWGEEAAGQPRLMIEESGSFSGSDGCNTLRGSWEQDGATINFGEIAATKMACPDVDTWLMNVDTARIDGDTLLVSDASGVRIGSLDKASQ